MQALTPRPQNAGESPSVKLAPAVPALTAMASIICAAVLMGWFTNNLGIAGFGRNDLFMQPWTAIACIGLSAAFFFAATQHLAIARCLCAIPLMIALLALLQDVLAVPFGIDQILFSDTLLQQNRVHPGRPGLMPALSILILALANFANMSGHSLPRRTVMVLGCIALSIAIISGTLLPLGFSSSNPMTRRALMSVPTASTIIALSLAIIAQRRHVDWPTNPACGLRASTLQWILPPCVLMPVVAALWQLWNDRNGQVTREMAEIVQAVVQVAASCTVIAWAWVRIGRESTARWAFSTAIDSAPIAITDVDGRVIRWSKGCERLYGWTAEEARGQLKHRLTQALLPPNYRQSLIPDHPQEIEISERRRDGTQLRIIESHQIVQPRSDIAPMVVLSMTDITARQRAERAMLASEARLAFAADLHELGLFEWSSVTDRMQLSPHAERLFGFEPGAFRGGMVEWRDHVRTMFGSDILAEQPIPQTGSDRIPFHLLLTDKNQPRIVEGSIFFHEPPGEQGLAMLGIIMDATERERRTEMLKAQESELRSILETVPEAMITVDKDGLVRSFSTAAERLFGRTAEEITGRDIRGLLPDYTKPTNGNPVVRDDVALLWKAPQPRTTVGLDRDGNEMPVELAARGATIGKEHISIAFVSDLRDRLSTQARLNELRDQLLHAARVSAMGEIGAGLAHELNQPLTATANFLGAANIQMARGASPEDICELVERANSEVLRAGKIIHRMRAFVAKGELDIRALPLDEMIADAIQLVWSGTHHASVHLHYQRSTSVPTVLADHVQIQQVLVNIIRNALDALIAANTPKPEITIRTNEQHDGTILIQLLDNGPGFPPSIIDHPFEAFVSTKANGMGLGLSICRRIVEAHGGILTLANGRDGGAVIEFTLPAYRDVDLKAAL
jgi:two-component system sensor kinase FixL